MKKLFSLILVLAFALTLTAAKLVQLIAFATGQAHVLQGAAGALGNFLRLKAMV